MYYGFNIAIALPGLFTWVILNFVLNNNLMALRFLYPTHHKTYISVQCCFCYCAFLKYVFCLMYKNLICSFFSSPEPKAHRWANSIPVTPSSVRRLSSVRQHFQTSSPLKPPGQLNSNFMWRLLRTREQKFVQMVLVTWPRWPPCPYMVKTL